jgi:transcriptional regulator with XRE-family HTH domain
LFSKNNIKLEEMADLMGIKKDSLYRKIIGRNGFSEKDIKNILKVLNLKFEEVFI